MLVCSLNCQWVIWFLTASIFCWRKGICRRNAIYESTDYNLLQSLAFISFQESQTRSFFNLLKTIVIFLSLIIYFLRLHILYYILDRNVCGFRQRSANPWIHPLQSSIPSFFFYLAVLVILKRKFNWLFWIIIFIIFIFISITL